MEEEDRMLFLEDMGLTESGVNRIIKAAYKLLNFYTYFTAGEKEVRAWTITSGFTAPQAAGVIHTDFENKFIKAETVNWKDLVDNNGWSGAKESGCVRMEGKEYIMQEGDVVLFKFGG